MTDQSIVEKVADLAQIELQESEVQKLSQDFEKILNSFNQINSVNTTGIEPMLSPTSSEFFCDEDEVRPFAGAPEQFLEAAPEKKGNLYKVPPVV